jgi:tRNA (cmo5U34)-methyltransferase
MNFAEYQQITEYLKLAEQSQYSHDAVKARFEAEPAVNYGGNMAQWIPDYAYAHQLLLNSLMIHLPSEGHMLELGAGSGRISQMLLDTFPDMNLALVDISANMLKAAEQRLQGDAARCCYVVYDIFDPELEFPAASFDGIVSVFAICHARGIEVYQRLYERIYRWLKSPGYFVCYDHVLGDTVELTALNALGWHQLLASNQSIEQAREGVISTYQEDSPLSLRQHLTLLSAAGFPSADVLYKRDIFAIYAAIKA